jgi:epoxide hydrolase 4
MPNAHVVQSGRVDANNQTFHTLAAGDPSAPLVLCLHGFPEFSGAWAGVLPQLADAYFAVAPDQRGYGRSSKPVGVEHYRVQRLAKDMLALAEEIAPGRPIHLVAHDWGASVAYMMAFLAPARIAKLIILNGVHPIPFQRALIGDPDQAAASQYIHFLRRDDAAALLLENNCRRLLEFLTGGFGGGRWLTGAKRAAYLDAWQQPGGVEAMVSWYKATPLVVPRVGETIASDPLAYIPQATVRVRMPHLLLWGAEDKALRPSCIAGLDAFCDDLTVRHIANAGHWIVHQQTAEVVQHIRTFLIEAS